METDERPEEGEFLEVWLDIPEVGEPIVRYWKSDGDQYAEWLAAQERDDAEILVETRPFPDRDEWLVHAVDPGVGYHAMWVRLRES